MGSRKTLPYVRGSQTSKMAAEDAATRAPSIREQVYQYIAGKEGDGATDREIELALGLRHQTASARRRELVQEGRVFDSGHKRATEGRNLATVWLVTSGEDKDWMTSLADEKEVLARRISLRVAKLSLDKRKKVLEALDGIEALPERDTERPLVSNVADPDDEVMDMFSV
jgi:hypothetical protein